MAMQVKGVVVVRGPDWIKGDEDGGEGHMGTIEVDNYDCTVTVQWDMGKTGTYSTGFNKKHELRVLDYTQSGTQHVGMSCISCQVPEIAGTLWQCGYCQNATLCNRCYCFDEHDIKHPFIRVDNPGSAGVSVEKRSISTKIRSMGICLGSTVKPRENVGHIAQIGTVSEIFALKRKGCQREAVIVTWQDGTTSTCMVGFQGKVDLVCVDEMPGLEYYRDHMLVLDTISSCEQLLKSEHSMKVVKGQSIHVSSKAKLHIGDKVCVCVPAANLKELQWGHGGWNNEMNRYIGKYGELKHVEKNGDYIIDYNIKKFRINPGAVRKVPTLKCGDYVKIIEDADIAKQLQQAHGGWSNEYESTLGKVGKVVKIDSDGDVAVELDDTAFVFNAACCQPIVKPNVERFGSNRSTSSQPKHNKKEINGDDVHKCPGKIEQENPLTASLEESLRGLQELLRHLANLSQGMLTPTGLDMGTMLLMNASATNDIALLQNVLKNNPELVNTKQNEFTALMIASHEGHKRVVEMLLAAGAELDLIDDNGNTALMSAALRSREDVAMMLIRAGANVNMRNNKGQSTLHFCAIGQANTVMKELMKQKMDPNVQEVSRGDTPLHLAVMTHNTDGALILMSDPLIEIEMPNKIGHTALSLAAMRGNVKIVQAILDKSPDLVDSRKPIDGFSALHVAAVNDNADVVEILLQNNANVNTYTNQGFVPLHLSCKEGFIKSSKILIVAGTYVNTQDFDGNTPLHLCVSQIRTTGASMMHMLQGGRAKFTKEIKERTELGCLLIFHGADVNITNAAGLLPLQNCRHNYMRDVLKTCWQIQITNKRRASQFIFVHSRRQDTNLLLQFLSRTSTRCICCTEGIASITLQPCNHLAVCGTCASQMFACPVCGDETEASFYRDGKKMTRPSQSRNNSSCTVS